MLTIAADVIFAVVALAAAVRFGAEVGSPPPDAAWPVAALVAAQIAGVLAMRGYRIAPATITIRRFALGVILATIVIAVPPRLLWPGLLPLRLAAPQAVLLLIIGTMWRSALAVWRLTHTPAVIPPPGMSPVTQRRTLALGVSDLFRYRGLVRNLVWRDLKLKYRGSALGFLWSLLNPIVMLAVYTVAFTYFMRGAGKPDFVLHLLLGLLAWTFFANSAIMSTGSVVDAAGLLKSVYFPRTILPIATVLFNLAQYLLTLVVFLPVVFIYYRVTPTPAMVAFPFFLALQVLFTAGVAFTLAAMTALYRDVRHLTEITLAVLFWLTPVLYAVKDLPVPAQMLVRLSPMSPFVTAYQNIFYDRLWPEPWVVAVALCYAVAMPLIGATLFLSLEERFAEQI